MEYKSLRDFVIKDYKANVMDYMEIWRSVFRLEAIGVSEYSNILKLAELCLTFAVSNAKSETGFSHIKRVHTRAQLSENNVSSIMRVVMDGKPYMEYNSTKAVEVFLKQKNRKRTYDADRQKKASGDNVPKKMRQYKTVQKTLFELSKK